MGRFSPAVAPEPLDLGGALERAAAAYFGRRRQKREERFEDEERRLRQEDRSRFLRALRARELSQPGAATLSQYLDESLQAGAAEPTALSAAAQPRFRGTPLATLQGSPQAAARFREEAIASSPLTAETLRRVSQAEETEVPIEFRRPAPTPVRVSSGRTAMLQERAPYLSETGVVMDPRRAREERTLAGVLEQRLQRQEALPTPEEREAEMAHAEALERARRRGARPTPEQREEDLAYQGELARRTGLLDYRRRPPASSLVPRPPVSLGALERQIDDTRELLTLLERTSYAPLDEEDPVEQQSYQAGLQRFERVRQRLLDLMLERDETVRKLRGVPENLPVAAPIFAKPPARAAVPAPTGQGRAAPTLPARAPMTELMKNVTLTTEQRQKYDQLVQQGWSEVDAADEIAADEWDALVTGGMDPDEATRTVATKYGLTEGP